ncbi:hypothetical protein [Demequina litorisediminis]|uniref:hypothetical protein n=1 Tax=Demequina litorisediminis TaxID=1849022 RepID=UPI0024E11390|nr:hypothetical protein [Demequina litorisediminis]
MTGQIVDTDIDGLLTAALLHDHFGWPIMGFYDKATLWLDADIEPPLDLTSVVWVDAEMLWPGARVLSQHVPAQRRSDLRAVGTLRASVNPSVIAGHAQVGDYANKYPFGTFQWAWWVLNRDPASARLDNGRGVGTGLAWMPDGGFQSVNGRFRDNCIRWATQHMPGSLMSPLAHGDVSDVRASVREAEAWLQQHSGVRRGWVNHQWRMPIREHLDDAVDLSDANGFGQAGLILGAIKTFYAWSRELVLPPRYRAWRGTWMKSQLKGLSDGWLEGANAHRIVSGAAPNPRDYYWTAPGSPVKSGRALSDILPGPAYASRVAV